MAYISIFDTTNLSFMRKSEGQGYLDQDNNWVEPEDVPVSAIGDLQPLRTNTFTQIPTPQGFSLKGGWLFSSKAKLRTVQEHTRTSADSTFIDGRRFYVASKEDWSDGPLSTDQYITYYLMLEELPNNGAPQ